MPRNILTDDGNVVIMEMSKAIALICKGFELVDCRAIDEFALPGVYIYVFSDSEETRNTIIDFEDNKLLIEPNQYWEVMTDLHQKHHERSVL